MQVCRPPVLRRWENQRMLSSVVLGLVSSVLSRETGWEERLRNGLYCVEWDLKRSINQLIVSLYQL